METPLLWRSGPTTTSVPCTVICAMALIQSTVCTGVFRSSSVSLRMLEAPAFFMEISPSEWPPPYLALDVVHMCPSYTTSFARNMHLFFLSSNPTYSSLPKTMSSVSRCCVFVAPVKMMSSKYTETCGMPCKIFSMVLWNIAGAELMPYGNILYRNNPLCVFMVTYSFDD